ncbi:Polypeptide N-acetylgalactosaminyltransferase 18 [Liparis tanakae]|uniref:Polypeptide N-acetylgalactosaminyltransferase 18 n=1 Tax=Liparis tanakae TaxID=230148 RepID=A0A4Z2J8T5_9TELE|nr:Polypeptide N-acetylgalactosaminyltransferase 18 [Liparis tanakae]
MLREASARGGVRLNLLRCSSLFLFKVLNGFWDLQYNQFRGSNLLFFKVIGGFWDLQLNLLRCSSILLFKAAKEVSRQYGYGAPGPPCCSVLGEGLEESERGRGIERGPVVQFVHLGARVHHHQLVLGEVGCCCRQTTSNYIIKAYKDNGVKLKSAQIHFHSEPVRIRDACSAEAVSHPAHWLQWDAPRLSRFLDPHMQLESTEFRCDGTRGTFTCRYLTLTCVSPASRKEGENPLATFEVKAPRFRYRIAGNNFIIPVILRATVRPVLGFDWTLQAAWRDVGMACTRRTKTLVSTCVILSGMTNIVCLLYVGWVTNYIANIYIKVPMPLPERKLEGDKRGDTLRIIERLDRLENVVNQHIQGAVGCCEAPGEHLGVQSLQGHLDIHTMGRAGVQPHTQVQHNATSVSYFCSESSSLWSESALGGPFTACRIVFVSTQENLEELPELLTQTILITVSENRAPGEKRLMSDE